MANLGGVIKPVKSTKEKLEIVGSQNTIISNQYNTEKYIFYICDDLNCCAAEEFEKIDDDALQRHNVKKKDTRDLRRQSRLVPIAVHTKRTILMMIDSTSHATT